MTTQTSWAQVQAELRDAAQLLERARVRLARMGRELGPEARQGAELAAELAVFAELVADGAWSVRAQVVRAREELLARAAIAARLEATTAVPSR